MRRARSLAASGLPSLRGHRQVRSVWFQSEQVSLKHRSKQRIDWWNPGKRIESIPDEVLYAMPPPPPGGARSRQEHRSWLLRTRIPVIALFLAAAGHWTISSLGDRRSLASEMERSAPWLAAALTKLGVFSSYPEATGFDRRFAMERVFERFGAPRGGIPLREAVGICAAILSAGASDGGEGPAADPEGVAARLLSRAASGSGSDKRTGGATGASDSLQQARLAVGEVVAARIEAGEAPSDAASRPLSKGESVEVLLGAASSLPDRAAYLVLASRLGVHAVSRDAADVVGQLFDLVAGESRREAERAEQELRGAAKGDAPPGAGRDQGWLAWLWPFSPETGTAVAEPGSAHAGGAASLSPEAVDDPECVMTVPLLAALCEELGLGFREAEARDALTDTTAVRTGRLRIAPAEWLVVEPPSVAVQHRKQHGEQSPEELAMLAEEVARAAVEASGVSPTPGTDWERVRRAADERARRELGDGARVPAFRELAPGSTAAEDEVRDLRLRSRLVVRSHLRVPMRRSEFVDFLTRIAAGMGEEELVRYCEVFFFMSGLRYDAGVQGPGETTAEAAVAAQMR